MNNQERVLPTGRTIVQQIEHQLKVEKADPRPLNCPCGGPRPVVPFTFCRMWNREAAEKGAPSSDGIHIFTVPMCESCYERFLLGHCIREAE